MNNIKDLWDRNVFMIDKIIQEYNSPQKQFIIRVNNNSYIMNYYELDKLCKMNDINLQYELSSNHYPLVIYDNRPLWKKDIDMRMGKKVNFHNKPIPHYPNISAYTVNNQIKDRKNTIDNEIQEENIDFS